MTQPIPHVTPGDVERIVRRDYSADEYATVMAILNGYGAEKWHREPTRVQLATLKLANASVQRLQTYMETAKRDYRDVIGPAEYPAYSKAGWARPSLPDDERNRIYESDWKQYEEWLKR